MKWDPLHNSPLREAVTALAQPADDTAAPVMIGASPSAATPAESTHRQAARYFWALLLVRIYEVLPLLCPTCGGEMKIIAFITEGAVIREILGHLGEPTSPPRLIPARGPPLWVIPDSGSDTLDPQAQPEPDYAAQQISFWDEFDKRVAW